MNGFLLNYEISGGGEKTVVLLPGLLASIRYWDKVKNILEKEYKVIVLDQLGFGNSVKPDDETEYGYEDNISSIHKTLQELKLNKYILVGYSSSSLIALNYSKYYSNEIEKLVLITPPFYFDPKEADTELCKSFRTYKYFLRGGAISIPFKFFINIFRPFLKAAAPLMVQHVPADSARNVFDHTWKSLNNTIRNIVIYQKDYSFLSKLNCNIKIIYANSITDNFVKEENILKIIKLNKNIKLIKTNYSHQIPIEASEFLAGEIVE